MMKWVSPFRETTISIGDVVIGAGFMGIESRMFDVIVLPTRHAETYRYIISEYIDTVWCDRIGMIGWDAWNDCGHGFVNGGIDRFFPFYDHHFLRDMEYNGNMKCSGIFGIEWNQKHLELGMQINNLFKRALNIITGTRHLQWYEHYILQFGHAGLDRSP